MSPKARLPRSVDEDSSDGVVASASAERRLHPAVHGLLRSLEILATLTPYGLGVLFSWFPIRRIYFNPFLERATYFLLLFGLWHTVLWVVFQWYLPTRTRAQPAATSRNALAIGALVTSSIALLLVLQFFRVRMQDEHFYISLFALGGIALQRAYSFRGALVGALAGRLCAISGVSYLSFLIVDPALKWEAIIPCVALACMFVGRDLVTHLDRESADIQRQAFPFQHYKMVSRSAVVAFILGPTLVSSLCYFGKLSSSFIFLFAICPLLLPLAELLRKGEPYGPPPPSIGWRGRVIFVAYAAILVAVGLLGRLS